MAPFNGKDIDRVCRASGMSRGRAEALLQQYGGRPDRVLEEHCGIARVYAQPERVAEPENALSAVWQGVTGFFGGAWQWLSEAGRRVVSSPILPVILLALAAPLTGLVMALAQLFMKLPL